MFFFAPSHAFMVSASVRYSRPTVQRLQSWCGIIVSADMTNRIENQMHILMLFWRVCVCVCFSSQLSLEEMVH